MPRRVLRVVISQTRLINDHYISFQLALIPVAWALIEFNLTAIGWNEGPPAGVTHRLNGVHQLNKQPAVDNETNRC